MHESVALHINYVTRVYGHRIWCCWRAEVLEVLGKVHFIAITHDKST